MTLFSATQDTLTRARAGDERAFDALTAPHRGELRLHCYRMLGSLTDADDALQETLLAAWRGLGGYEERASVRTWLYRIATNCCLNAIRAGRARLAPPEPAPPFVPPAPTRHADVTWLQPCPDTLLDAIDLAPGPDARLQTREHLELAFVEALQRLPARQTAALVLCEVLGFSAEEVAGMLDTSATAVKGLLRRARATLDERRPDPPPVPPDAEAERRLARRFADTLTAGDVDSLVALLTADAWLNMPPAPHEYVGPAAIGAFLRASVAWHAGRLRLQPARANRQPAFVCHLVGADGAAEPAGVIVLTLAGERISRITRFLDPRALGLFERATALLRAPRSGRSNP